MLLTVTTYFCSPINASSASRIPYLQPKTHYNYAMKGKNVKIFLYANTLCPAKFVHFIFWAILALYSLSMYLSLFYIYLYIICIYVLYIYIYIYIYIQTFRWSHRFQDLLYKLQNTVLNLKNENVQEVLQSSKNKA